MESKKRVINNKGFKSALPPEVKGFFKEILIYIGFPLLNFVFIPLQLPGGIFGTSLGRENFYYSLVFLVCIFTYGFLLYYYPNRRPLIIGILYYFIPAFILQFKIPLKIAGFFELWFYHLAVGLSSYKFGLFISVEMSIFITLVCFITGFFSRFIIGKLFEKKEKEDYFEN
jgi:hypothetical protein